MAFNLGNFDLGNILNTTGFESSFDVPMVEDAPTAPARASNLPTNLAGVQERLALTGGGRRTAYEEALANLPDNVRQSLENTQLPPGVRENLVLLGGEQEETYGEAGKYESPEQALANYSKEYQEVKDAVARNTVIYNMRNAYRNPERAASGVQAFNPQAGGAAQERLTNFLEQNNIPLSKEIDGKTYYLTLGTGMQGAGTNVLKEETGKKHKDGQWVVGGAPGTYSTQYIPPMSNMEKALSNPILNMAAGYFPGGSAILAGLKAASGMELSPTEILTLVGAAVDFSGIAEGATAVEAQAAAEVAVDNAFAAGTITSGAQAQALYESTLAAQSLAPSIFGVKVSDIAGLATGRTSFGDVMGSISKNAFPELTAAMEASQKAGVPEGVILNWSEKAIDAYEKGGTLDSATDAFNILRKTYLETEEKKAADDAQAKAAADAQAKAEQDRIAAEQAEADRLAEEARLAKEVETGITTGDGELPVTGITPDPVKGDQGEVDPIFDKEPIVFDPPAIDIGGGGGGDSGAGGDAGGDQGGGEAEGGDILLKQVYEAVLANELPIEDYIKMGGKFVEELRAGIPYEDVYGPPSERPIDTQPSPPLDDSGEPTEEDSTLGWDLLKFYEEFGGEVGDKAFEIADLNADGIVSADELKNYQETVVGGGAGTGTGVGGTDGTGTTGGVVTGGGETGDGTGTGGTGTGTGEGDGTGGGTGDGTGDGTGTGIGTDIAAGAGVPSATGMLGKAAPSTVELMFPELFKSKVVVGSDQEVSPFIKLQQRGLGVPANEGMLTNSNILRRYQA